MHRAEAKNVELVGKSSKLEQQAIIFKAKIGYFDDVLDDLYFDIWFEIGLVRLLNYPYITLSIYKRLVEMRHERVVRKGEKFDKESLILEELTRMSVPQLIGIGLPRQWMQQRSLLHI